MSQSEWKDLPDWQNKDEYAFLDNARPEVWTWEFLRRNPEYRTDWLLCSDKKSVIIYDPPKRENESNTAWKQRVRVANGKPIETTLDKHIARKWLLQELYDPFQPFSQGVCFHKPAEEFPRMIIIPEHFEELLEEEELEDGSPLVRVANRNVVYAFDITRPITDQLTAVKNSLTRWKKEMLATGRVVQVEGTAGKIDIWKRHLQVLDAERMCPDIDYKVIGEILWINKPVGTKAGRVRNEGKKFSDAAHSQMQHYKKILQFKDSTGKIKKS